MVKGRQSPRRHVVYRSGLELLSPSRGNEVVSENGGKQRMKRAIPEMPFGKYAGRKLNRLPNSYIKWLLENCDLSQRLRDDLIAVFNGEPLPLSPEQELEKIWKEKK
jgi:hypothetical protein